MKKTTRRSILAGATVGLSGCLATTERSNGPNSGEDSGGSENTCGRSIESTIPPDEVDPAPPGASYPSLSVSNDGLEETEDQQLELDVGIVQQYSNESVAKVRIDLSNRGDDPVTVGFGPSPPFSSYRSLGGARQSPTAFVVPENKEDMGIVHIREDRPGDEPVASPVDGCWKIHDVGWNSIAHSRTIRPNCVLGGRYSVYASSANAGCLPDGQYRFRETWSRESGRSLEGGFTIVVEES